MPTKQLEITKISPRLGMMTSVDDSLLVGSGYVKEQINMHSDVYGKTTVRDGITQLGSQIVNNYPILALYNFRDSGAGTNNQLLAVIQDGTNNDIYYLNGSTWTKTLEDDTAGEKTRFATFSDRVIRVNDSDNMKSWSGTGAWSTSGDPINEDDMASHDCKFIETMMARVFIAGETSNPDRLYFSSVADVDGNIEWTPTTNYIDINPNDGSNIMALKRFGTKLLVFKKDYLYRVEGTGFSTSTDPDPLIGIGTHSQESVVEGKGGIYYHNPIGFFVYKGGYPEEISKPIQEWVDAITVANYSEVVGWSDRDHIYWSVGDVTVDGTSYSNIVLCYTISSNVWFVYSYPNKITAACQYYGKSTTEVWQQVIGDEDGNVYVFNSGDTDNSTAIQYSLITHFYDFGLLSYTKNINRLLVASKELPEAHIAWQTSDMNKDEWHNLGQLQKNAMDFKDLNIKGEEIRFKIFGARTNDGGYLRYIELLDNISEGIIK